MRVALLQYPIAWADKETNLRLAEERIAALAGKADVAVLPEMFATGFCTDHPELAETMNGDIIHRLQAAADQSGVAIVSSFICLPIGDKAMRREAMRLVNRGFMIKPHAPIEIQDKRHLYAHGGEDLFFQPAEERHIFEYKGVSRSTEARGCGAAEVCLLRFPTAPGAQGLTGTQHLDGGEHRAKEDQRCPEGSPL